MTSEAGVANTASDRLALFVASGAGAGYLPIAPGTWGSAIVPAVLVPAYLMGVPLTGARATAVFVGVSLLLGWAGCWAGDRVAKILDDDDPSLVVVDEVVGQLLTYSLVPVSGIVLNPTNFAVWMIAGFFLFRALDIFKPGPIDALQQAHGGIGIMADDFLAGVVGAWLLLVIALIF